MPPTFMIPVTGPRNRLLSAFRYETETLLQQNPNPPPAGALNTVVAAWRGRGLLRWPVGKRPTPVQLREALRDRRVIITASLGVQLASERVSVEAERAKVFAG